MKASLSLSLLFLALSFSQDTAFAQESARVPEVTPDSRAAVDASVHAGIDEQSAKQPQPSRQGNKRQAKTLSWGAVRTADQSTGTQSQPAPSENSLQQKRNDNVPVSRFDLFTRSREKHDDPLREQGSTPSAGFMSADDQAKGISSHSDPRSALSRKLPSDFVDGYNYNAPSSPFKPKSASLFPYAYSGATSTIISGGERERSKWPPAPGSFSTGPVSNVKSAKSNSQRQKSAHSSVPPKTLFAPQPQGHSPKSAIH